jgi:hypothetical protein
VHVPLPLTAYVPCGQLSDSDRVVAGHVRPAAHAVHAVALPALRVSVSECLGYENKSVLSLSEREATTYVAVQVKLTCKRPVRTVRSGMS